MDQILALIPRDGAWSIVALLFILVFGSQQILSEEGAKKFWVVGRLARRIESRKKRSIEKEIDIEKTRAEHLESLIEDLRVDLESERKRSRRVEREMRSDLADAWGYVRWATSWAHDVMQMAAEHGWKPPMPPWKTHDQWLSSRDD